MDQFQQNLSKSSLIVQDVRAHLSNNENTKALKLLTQSSKKTRNNPEILFLFALAYEKQRSYKKALQYAKESLRKREHIHTFWLIARCHRALGNTEEALELCAQLEQRGTNMIHLVSLRAGVLEEAGRFKEAAEVLSPAIDRCLKNGDEIPKVLKFEWAKVLLQQKEYIQAINILNDIIADDIPDQLRCSQLYLLAKAYDRSQNYSDAWHAASQANSIDRVEYNPDLHKEGVGALVQNWSRERIQKYPKSTCKSDIPVFVAGMPRSGTSLVDQIIDAHPEASGVGELGTIEKFSAQLGAAYNPNLAPPECFGNHNSKAWTRAAENYVREIRRLAPGGVKRIVNKALGNNKLVGLLTCLYPNTRILHVIRDPRDVAISCFMGGFNNNIHAWTTQVEWVVKAWEQSECLMQHWKETLDVPILDVHYERLVADPDNEFPRIIEFLGLEWDDACYEFHKTKRTVRTLSYDQVNRPLYTSSSGRHANYAKYIEDIKFPLYDPWSR